MAQRGLSGTSRLPYFGWGVRELSVERISTSRDGFGQLRVPGGGRVCWDRAVKLLPVTRLAHVILAANVFAMP
jgi:hypothetical protein